MKLGKLFSFAALSFVLAACSGGGGGGGGNSDTKTEVSDTTPDAFSFVDVVNAKRNTLVVSEAIVVEGINSETSIEIEGGEYSINNGGFTAAAGKISNEDEFRVRILSSSDLSAEASAELTIGGVSDSFEVTTRADEVAPSAEIEFPKLQDTWVYEPLLIIRGTATDNRGVEAVYVNGVLAETSDDFQNWQLPVSITGKNTEFSVIVVDVDGNETELDSLVVNAHQGNSQRAFRALSIDVNGGILFAGPRLTKIDDTKFEFELYPNLELTVSHLVFDPERNKLYGMAGDNLVELSHQTGEVLQQFYAGSSYTSALDIDPISGKLYWADGRIQSFDPSTGVFETVSNFDKGAGPELNPDALIVVNNQLIYAISGSDLIQVNKDTGDRTLLSNLYESDEKITEVISVDSHSRESKLYLLAKSELTPKGAENLYSFDLAKQKIEKIFDQMIEEDVFADFLTSGLQIDHKNDLAYILSYSSGHLYSINLKEKSLKQVSSGYRGQGPALAGNAEKTIRYDTFLNRLIVHDSSIWSDFGGKLLSINIDSGDREILSGPNTGSGPEFSDLRDVTITSGGRIFVADYGDDSFKEVDATTGDRKVFISSDVGCCNVIKLSNAIDVDPEGVTAVVINDMDYLLKVDVNTGTKSILSSSFLGAGSGPDWNGLRDIETNFDAGVVYALGHQTGAITTLYEVDLNTGDRKILASEDQWSNVPHIQHIFLSEDKERLLFIPRDKYTGYFEYNLKTSQLVKKPYAGTNVSILISGFAEYGDRLFGITNVPNSVVEIDQKTGSMVIISQ
ncbi:hypothetical protein ACJJIC_02085 [Microbulbifer sp. ANSA002]|uniref:hypothetical protein n=1 Tax=unclassified Microbulbifer TaxID=2619833 RepID=UPI0040418C1A